MGNFQSKQTVSFQNKEDCSSFQNKRTETAALGWGFQPWGISAWGGRPAQGAEGWSSSASCTSFQTKTTASFQEKI